MKKTGNVIFIFAFLALLSVFTVMQPPAIVYETPEPVIESTPEPTPTPTPTPSPTPEPTPEITPEPTPEPTPPPPPLYLFAPKAAESTDPSIMLKSEAIMAAGTIVDEYEFDPPINFGFGDEYAQLEGIVTFRGNNFRDSGSYGFADIRNEAFGEKWTRRTDLLQNAEGAAWQGHGWTGQPLIVKWPIETRSVMTNMKSWAREQDELIEVIYPGMGGYVYFQELETGKDTRDKLFLGWPFKGSGALDPRGYPLLYVGAGDTSARGYGRIFIVSLIDGAVLHTFGTSDGFALRKWWPADSSPLVDAENDRLIYPSENGIIYILDLNTDYDPDSGTISIDPVTVKWRFQGVRSAVNSKYWLGFEASITIFREFAYIPDNGGHMICLNLNTLQTVWIQDILDDSNSTPVFSVEDDRAYIYVSTSYHQGWRAAAGNRMVVPIWKLDAETGEIIWQVDDYDCATASGLSGGVQGTIAIGFHELEDLIFVPIARVPNNNNGILSAISKSTGEIVWEFKTTAYSWSSPTCVYTEDGKGYIVYTDRDGYLYLLDGLTGRKLDSIKLDTLVEASPAVYGNTVVIGTRNQHIYGIKIT